MPSGEARAGGVARPGAQVHLGAFVAFVVNWALKLAWPDLACGQLPRRGSPEQAGWAGLTGPAHLAPPRTCVLTAGGCARLVANDRLPVHPVLSRGVS